MQVPCHPSQISALFFSFVQGSHSHGNAGQTFFFDGVAQAGCPPLSAQCDMMGVHEHLHIISSWGFHRRLGRRGRGCFATELTTIPPFVPFPDNKGDCRTRDGCVERQRLPPTSISLSNPHWVQAEAEDRPSPPSRAVPVSHPHRRQPTCLLIGPLPPRKGGGKSPFLDNRVSLIDRDVRHVTMTGDHARKQHQHPPSGAILERWAGRCKDESTLSPV